MVVVDKVRLNLSGFDLELKEVRRACVSLARHRLLSFPCPLNHLLQTRWDISEDWQGKDSRDFRKKKRKKVQDSQEKGSVWAFGSRLVVVWIVFAVGSERVVRPERTLIDLITELIL